MSTALVPVSDLEKMASAVAASKLFGITTPEQAMALMLVAQAEGLHPATAARDYHIIQGRPTLKADAMLARYLASGGKVEWGVHTDTEVEATFSHPQGGTLKIKWDMARAKAAELGGKGMWTKYPRQMLRARVISEGVRATNPAVAVGIYTPEEAEDFEPAGSKGRGAKAKPAGDAVVVTDRTELAKLCDEAKFSIKFYLNRAEVERVEDMTEDDYAGAVEAARRKVAKAKEITQEIAQGAA
jgi:hypothetical protein